MSVTLKEIAKELGVSPSTISKALNDQPGVSEDLRNKIIHAVKEKNLRPKQRGSGLVKDNTLNIVLMVRINQSLESDPFYALITEGISKELQHYRSNLLYHVLHERQPDDALFAEIFESKSVDGAILIGADLEPKLFERISRLEIPAVLVDNQYPGFCSVNTDNYRGALEGLKHLAEFGHKDIVFLSGPLEHQSIRQRYQGYLDGMRNYAPEAKPALIECAGVSVDDGYRALQAYAGRSFTGVFAANDKLAIGAIKALKEEKYSIPKDISVIGFDDIEWGLHMEPALTTIRIAKHQMGSLAAQLLMHYINGDAPHSVDVTVATKLVPRQSAAAAGTR